MAFLTDLLRFIALSHLLVLLWLLWKERTLDKGKTVCLFFVAAIAGYLLAGWPPLQDYPWLHIPLLVLPFLAPMAFWLFSKWLFDDGFRWQRSWWGLMAGVVAVFYLTFFQNKFQVLPLPPSLQLLSGLIGQLISLTFILLGIVEAARNRAADLVLSRLQFRTIFIAAAALLMMVTALVEVSLAGAEAPPVLDVLQKAAIAGLTVFFALHRLTFKPGFFPKSSDPVPASPANLPDVDERLLAQLADLMINQKIWRTEGLTIRLLAAEMGVKEYRLRQAINQHLGFRNFNDYLHTQRISEACAVLADPAKRDLTVLEIAYDLGYASLAPFNKAFRGTTGMSPTEWRRDNSR